MSASSLTVVILAAGEGTRMGRLSEFHSKAMAPVLGDPIILKVIDKFVHAGVNEFITVKGPEEPEIDKIMQKFNGRTAVQRERLGTAHALLQARDLIKGDFILCSCDNIFTVDHIRSMIKVFIEHRPSAVITLEEATPETLDKMAGVRLDGKNVIEIVEKPGKNSFGTWQATSKFLFVFQRKILDYLDKTEPSARGEHELQDSLRMFMEDCDDKPRGIFHDGCLHLSTERDLIEIQRHYFEDTIGQGTLTLALKDANVHESVELKSPVLINNNTGVFSGATVGPNVYVFSEASVGEGAVVENAIVYPKAVVKPGEKISWKVVLPEKKIEYPFT